MLDMVRKDIMPAVSGYTLKLSGALGAKKGCGLNLCVSYEETTLSHLCDLLGKITSEAADLEALVKNAEKMGKGQDAAEYYESKILPAMATLRKAVDAAETLTDRNDWPYPAYSEMLYGIE